MILWTRATTKNASSKTWFYEHVLPLKIELIEDAPADKTNVTTTKMYILRKTGRKFFHFMATFYNFAFKIEASLAKRVAKPILETRNANDVIAYVWFIIYSFPIKKI